MPSCFVVMGYGQKTDFQQNKSFDLDKSYRNIIKPAVEAAGYACERADDIQHAGVIDVPMYEKLLTADLVVADLSTANVNAFFDLGVRYALRPRTTIVIAEKNLKIPFDMGHVLVRHYEHLGPGIEFEEVLRMRDALTEACKAVVAGGRVDSPVYTFIADLTAPLRKSAPTAAEAPGSIRMEEGKLGVRELDAVAEATSPAEKAALTKPYATLMDSALKARAEGKFETARDILRGLRAVQGNIVDPFVVQQLALVTYKAAKPDPTTALLDARDALAVLDPEASSDPETLGLWGAIHKRLWDRPELPQKERMAALDKAIWAHEKAFYLKNDFYNGNNLSFLLYARAATQAGEEATADRVQARRMARRVHDIAQKALDSGVRGEDARDKNEQQYWAQATVAEALLGIGQIAQAGAALATATAIAPEQWMVDTTQQQFDRLRLLL
jgi:hypothetical protein